MNMIDNLELCYPKDVNKIWDLIKATVEGARGEKSFKIWFSDVEIISLENNVLTLSHPVAFSRKIIEAQFLSKIEQAIMKEYNHEVNVTIVPPIGSAEELLIHKWTTYGLDSDGFSVPLMQLYGDSEILEFINFLEKHMQTHNTITKDEIINELVRIGKKRPIPPLRKTKDINRSK